MAQAIEEREMDGELVVDGERLSLGIAARLSRYLQVLTQARKMGRETISSQELSEYTHINPTQIRRDLFPLRAVRRRSRLNRRRSIARQPPSWLRGRSSSIVLERLV